MKPPILKTIIFALLIRLILIPFFYHPDIKSQHFHFQFLSHKVLNIYQYISENKNQLPYRDTFNYLPLTYFTFGFFQIIARPFLPSDFNTWINDWGPDQNIYYNLPYFLLILKLPYLILDFLTAFLLFKITKSYFLSIFWLFNPLTIYFLYILGNFDIFPVFLTLLSYCLLASKPKLSFLVFGVAIAFKLYPLIFLPFFLFSKSKNIFKIIPLLLISLAPLFLSLLPFINNSDFWHSFLGSGLTQKILELKIYSLPVFPIIYIFLIIFSYISKSLFKLQNIIFYIFLLFISTVNFHPQWLLWFYPFILLLDNIREISLLILLFLLTIFLFLYIFLFNDRYLFWGHLIAIDPEFINITSLYDFIRLRLVINPAHIQKQIKIIISFLSIFLFLLNEKFTRVNHN